MLVQRVVTAVVLLLVFAVVLFWSPRWVLVAFLLLVAALASWEWAQLSGLAQPRERWIFAAVTTLNAGLLLLSPFPVMVAWLIAAIASLLWAVLLFRLTRYDPDGPAPGGSSDQMPGLAGYTIRQWNLALLGLVVITSVAVSIDALRFVVTGHSIGLLLYALAIVWVMDIGAYFAGRRFGKTKLAVTISPGKTREGVYGGLLAALVLFVVTVLLAPEWLPSPLALAAATFPAALFSVIGDLYESSLKRRVGIKDSSQLLPGHGGVLDRIDGVMAALPVFLLIWLVFT